MSGVQFGLVLKKKPGPALAKPKPVASRPKGGRNAFGDHSSDEDNLDDSDNDTNANSKNSRPSASSSSTAAVNKTLRPYAIATLQTSAVVEQHNEALAQDATAFSYDEVYDQLKAKDRMAELARKKDSEERKPKYVHALLQAAETRKRDRQIAEEKKIEREREQEGEEFKDKEKFITPAYKAQKEAMRLAEEEDRKREELLSQDKDGSLMQGFYKTMLEERTKLLRPDEDGSLSTKLSAQETEALEREHKAKEKSDRDLAEEARGRGLKVMLNDEGKIVDKRDLLKGGLNITKKPSTASSKPFSDTASASSSRSRDRRDGRDRYDDRRRDDGRRGGDSSRSGGYDRERAYADYKDQKYRSSRNGSSDHRGSSSNDSAPDQRSRMTEQIEQQLLEQEKKREEEEKQRQDSIREALKRKNEDGQVMDAKARFLARKKAAEEAAAAGKNKTGS
ncbi:hypothetical protein BGZ83_008364 [Gryganskiella cystojenkinii]|nr:hypothetical protein BGZ83_008364 [Gryganskiella cystojenkinii]